MNNEQHDWIASMASLAASVNHIFPEMAACEAALESRFGQSELAKEANNLFGQKQHQVPDHGTLVLPTREYLHGTWVVENAQWEKFDSPADSFAERMHTLRRLAPRYPHYKAALEAQDPTTYVMEVSQTWATDPKRGEKVLAIYSEYYKCR